MINGQPYNVKIVAVYADNSESPSSSVLTATPGAALAPTGLSVVGGNQKLTVSFTPSEFTGGFEVLNYSYDIWPATETSHAENWQSAAKATSPIVISGLTNGTAYKFKLRPENQTGAGQASPETSGTPSAEVPSAPTITSISTGNKALTVTFDPPTSNGGKPITSYKYSINNGVTRLDYAATSSPLDIDNLTNGTKYSVLLYAVNDVGVGPPSEAFEGTPSEGATPSAPRITGITGGIRQLSVAFTPPTKDNGSAITRYQYKLDSGRWTTRKPEASLNSPVLITGLASNKSYKVRLRAVNASGAGASSAVVLGSTTKSAPDTPEITGIDFSDGLKDNETNSWIIYPSFLIYFKVPEDDGGSPIVAYEPVIDGIGYMIARVVSESEWYDTNPLESSLKTLINETQGTGMLRAMGGHFAEYRIEFGQTNYAYVPIQLRAATAIRTPQVSADDYRIGEPSRTEIWTADPDGAPLAAPTDVTAIPLSSTSILISFTAPFRNIGPAIIGYKYSLNDGLDYSAVVQDVNGTITVNNLTPGTPYKVKIKADNGGPYAAASVTVNVTTEPEVPTAPTIYNITGLENALVVQISPPIIPGGVILDYEYSLNSGSFVSSGVSNSPITITGTSNDVLYTVAVRAVNQVGPGTVSNTATGISGSPSAPSITAVETGKGRLGSGGELKVYFNPPASDGGSSIIKYHYSTDNGVTYTSILNTTTNTTSVSPITISNLVNGNTYQIILKAENARSIGQPSQAASGTPYTTPLAPTITQLVVDTSKTGAATLYFTDPTSDGGSSIISYDYSVDNGNAWRNSTTAVNDNFIAITTSKNNSTIAQVLLRAVNAAGPGSSSNRISVSPITEPSAPSTLELTQIPQNPTQVTMRFTPPSSNGGSAITHYSYIVYDSTPDEVYVSASQLSGPSPYTVTLPNTFSYGSTARVSLKAINLGANSASPVTEYSGVGSLNFASLHVAPYTLTMPATWVQLAAIVYNSNKNRFQQLLSLKLPCNQSNTYIGNSVTEMQPLVTRVEYTYTNNVASGSGRVFDLFNVKSGDVFQRKFSDPPGVFTFIPDITSLPELPANNGDYEFTFTAYNQHCNGSPYTVKISYKAAPQPQLVTAPAPGSTKPPEYLGINVINISHALKFSRMLYRTTGPTIEYNMSIVEIYADLENTEISYSLSLRKAISGGFESQSRVTHELTLPIAKDYHPHEPAIGGFNYSSTTPGIDPTVFNTAEKPLIYEIWRRTFVPNRAVNITPGGLPFEGEIMSGGKQMLTLKIVGFAVGDEVKLTMASKNTAGVTHPSQTIVLNTTEDAKTSPYTMQPAWWACMATPEKITPNIPWGSSRGHLTIIEPTSPYRFPLTDEYYFIQDLELSGAAPTYLIGGGYGRSIPAVCPEAYPPEYDGGTIMLIAYDIEIYKLPINVLLGWRYRGEGNLMWRWFSQIDLPPDLPEAGEIMKTTLYHCPAGMLSLKQSQPNFPDTWYNESYYFPGYSGNNRALLRMTILDEHWSKLNTVEGAIDPRQLEFITCTAFEPKLGIPTENIGPIIPYYLNTSDPYVKECYASPPLSSGRVSVDVPKINYNWSGPSAPYAWDGYWTPTPYQPPTTAQINAFKARYPEYFSS
jgi:hypothetical protein